MVKAVAEIEDGFIRMLNPKETSAYKELLRYPGFTQNIPSDVSKIYDFYPVDFDRSTFLSYIHTVYDENLITHVEMHNAVAALKMIEDEPLLLSSCRFRKTGDKTFTRFAKTLSYVSNPLIYYTTVNICNDFLKEELPLLSMISDAKKDAVRTLINILTIEDLQVVTSIKYTWMLQNSSVEDQFYTETKSLYQTKIDELMASQTLSASTKKLLKSTTDNLMQDLYEVKSHKNPLLTAMFEKREISLYMFVRAALLLKAYNAEWAAVLL